jgi:DNA primase
LEREQLIELITTEDIIEILKDLGSENYKRDNKGNLYFLTVCHGGDSYKLYYLADSKFFICLTCCGSMSVFDVIMSAKNIIYDEAFEYVCKFKNINLSKKLKVGIQKKEIVNHDLDFLNLYTYKNTKQHIQLPQYDTYILNLFDDYLPYSWYKEGINDEISTYFKIKYYINQNKAIIPHYDIEGNLVGIRARSFSQVDIDSGRKYMPIIIQGLTYRYPMNFNLYGIYQNKENIKKYKKAIIFESEKSVMLYGSYYGQENNISVATCGMTFSIYQKDLLMSLGIEEIIICYDKQYQLEIIENENVDKSSKPWKEYDGFVKRLIKISEMFM